MAMPLKVGPRRFTDREHAVLIDSLAQVRASIRKSGQATPDLDSALRKLEALTSPDSHGFRAVPLRSPRDRGGVPSPVRSLDDVPAA